MAKKKSYASREEAQAVADEWNARQPSPERSVLPRLKVYPHRDPVTGNTSYFVRGHGSR